MNEQLQQLNQHVLIQLRLNRENLYDVKLKIDFDSYIERLQPFSQTQFSLMETVKYHLDHLTTYIFDIDQEIVSDMLETMNESVEQLQTMEGVEETMLQGYSWVKDQLEKHQKETVFY